MIAHILKNLNFFPTGKSSLKEPEPTYSDADLVHLE